MTASAQPGPISVIGQKPPVTGPTNPTGGSAALLDYNPDQAPSLFWMGIGLRDIEFMPRIGQVGNANGQQANQDCGFYMGTDGFLVIDQVPSTISTNNIAALQGSSASVALSLVAASAAGITVLSSAFTPLPTGLVVPSGSLAIDGSPAWLGAGQSSGFQFFDPTHGISRAVSLTSGGNLSAINYTIRGYDVYGRPMTQTLAGPNGNTVNTTKTFKFVASVTPSASSATQISVGTSDIYGLPLRVDRFQYVAWCWDVTWATNSTGFTAADTTSPATVSTGDVRGTIATPTASNGTRRLYVSIALPVANVLGTGTFAATLAALKGSVQV